MEVASSASTQAQATATDRKRLLLRVAEDYLQRTEGISFRLNALLVAKLYAYFTRQPDSELDIRKGLWLEGPIGTGKTTLMRVFHEFGKLHRQGFMLCTAAEIASAYGTSGSLDLYTANANGYSRRPVALCVDELGREQLPATHFGNRLNTLQYVLQQRYTLWQQGEAVTHVTTNLCAGEVRQLYGDFIFDRCRHMFNIVTLTGKSLRGSIQNT